jgi:hypothetical protein
MPHSSTTRSAAHSIRSRPQPRTGRATCPTPGRVQNNSLIPRRARQPTFPPRRSTWAPETSSAEPTHFRGPHGRRRLADQRHHRSRPDPRLGPRRSSDKLTSAGVPTRRLPAARPHRPPIRRGVAVGPASTKLEPHPTTARADIRLLGPWDQIGSVAFDDKIKRQHLVDQTAVLVPVRQTCTSKVRSGIVGKDANAGWAAALRSVA